MDSVVDSNVIIHGSSPRRLNNTVTVPGVLEEMKSREASKKMENSDIKIRKAPEAEKNKVQNLSNKINSPTSQVDENLVALALSTDSKIISDDKAVQNLALHLEIKYEGFIEDKIEQKRKWKKICSRCGEKFTEPSCHRCGSQNFRRKPV